MLFLARVAELGMTITRPWGDSAHYDLIVESDGCWLRVQVKSTMMRRSPNSYAFSLRGCQNNRYRRGDFDYIAGYIIPLDIWYIIPEEDAEIGKVTLCVMPGSPRNRYETYREAWHLLKQKRCTGNTRDCDLCFRHGCQNRVPKETALDNHEP